MNRLRELRKEKDVSVETILKLLKIKDASLYYKKETGIVKVSVNEALILSDFYGVSVNDIFLLS